MTLSIWVPVGYIGALILSLSLFSSIYRKRSARNAAKGSSEPWHPEGHPERDLYQSLLASGMDLPDHILKAALINRAMTDVKRIVQMRDDKQALAVLLQKGSIGDETMARFAFAEKELEAEILDVVSEANTFREGWGNLIFPTASEMVTHKKHKEVYYSIPGERTKQIALLKSQNKPIPKPTIELPPLFTPPGTQVKVNAPPPGALPPGAQGIPPAQLHQLMQAQKALQKQQQQQQQHQQQQSGSIHGPPRPPSGPASVSASPASKVNGAPAPAPAVKGGESVPTAATGATPTTPLTPSSKGNGRETEEVDRPDDSSWTTLSTPATPASARVSSSTSATTTAAATTGVEGEDGDESMIEDSRDEEDALGEEEEEVDSDPEGAGAAGGVSSTTPASPGVNRAQRRQNKKKQKKGGKK